ncbi:MAG: glucosamine-6-phosphate deaminase [Verrucomicrobia bacterium]|nr:glucosamine-6-phosphate deaminase [Verrucomicrobiota bacterium]
MGSLPSEAEQYERIRTTVFQSAESAVRLVAASIARLMWKRAAEGRTAVLGLATGSTPVKLYRELIRLHRDEGLSFSNVVTFNLDEYYGLPPHHPESYRHFMEVQLFDHVDISPENIHVPDGLISRSEVFGYCQEYERKILATGGIDVQILGIGRTGHIGFNEPGSGVDSRTRMVALDRLTRRDAARDFRGEENVPAYAITMGVGTILEAKELALLAWGESKAAIVREAIEGPQIDTVPASFLQRHPNCQCYLDEAAARELTRFRFPWKVGPVDWTPSLTRKAVVSLASDLHKPVLRLRDEDYAENGLATLILETGSAYSLNIRIFNELQHTITGWPGGKPNADDSNRPVPAVPGQKRVLVFGPEPLDAELGMAGTLHRLRGHQHEVTFAYLTSGNLGVPDNEARMAISLLHELSADRPMVSQGKDRLELLSDELEKKAAFDEDSRVLRQFKGLIRKAEARASCQVLGLDPSKVLFLDLPFYEKGRYRQFNAADEDVTAVRELCRRIQPHQIYLTGSGAEPGSVSGISFRLVVSALEECAGESWMKACQVWLYASGERPWSPHEIEMAVPLSPAELAVKLDCLYHHRSQRSQTPFLATQSGESWQQAENNNRSTAQHYDRLGLAEYEAIESFRCHKDAESRFS